MPHPQREHARQLRREGQTLLQIAEACGVTKGCISKWCQDLPEHAAVWERNKRADYARRKILPPGTEALNEEMRRAGIPPAERLRVVRLAALRCDAPEAGGRT